MRRRCDIENPPGYAKLLDAWVAPESAGAPVGVVTTTFTFNAAFFEEACLSRFLNLTTDPDEDGPVYLIEREEKLAGLRGATVLVDAHHCRGARSLRWDLLPVQVEKGGVLHAKVSLLVWSNLVRVIVASANMTEEAYRRNREIFGVLDYCMGSASPKAVVDDLILLLHDCLLRTYENKAELPAAQERANRVLEHAQAYINGLELDNRAAKKKKNLHVLPVISGPKYEDVFSQIKSAWPGGLPPISAYVTSPFYDLQTKENQPAKALWALLRQRGEADVTFNVLTEEIKNEEAIFIHAPASLGKTTPDHRANVETHFVQLPNELPSPSGVMTYRPLHMKQLWIEHDNWAMVMMGSSNFTSAGMGLGKTQNIEANLLYITHTDSNLPYYKLLQEAYPEGEVIDQELELRWQPLPDEEMEAVGRLPVLPAGFGQATFDRDNEGNSYLQLEMQGNLPDGWCVYLPQSDTVIIDEASWQEEKKPKIWEMTWNETLPPSGLEVTWQGSSLRVWWPVNVVSPSVLPPPKLLEDLPLEILIRILTSSRPLHEVLRRWMKQRRKDDEHEDIQSNIDPHKRVDTSSFLLQRTRRFSWALSALKYRLEQPVPTQEVLHWRLRGPVGVKALAEAISKEAHSEEEQVFLISELILELANIEPKEAAGCLKPDSVKHEIEKIILSVRENIEEKTKKLVPNLKQYVDDILLGVSQ